jgi:hypothetical protein
MWNDNGPIALHGDFVPTSSRGGLALAARHLNMGRCQSKIPNTCSGHRTAQIDPEKYRKINGREIRF